MGNFGAFGVFFAIFFVIILGSIIASVVYNFHSRSAIVKRAKKIDPTVSTYEEAQFVLKQSIAQNVGRNNTSNTNKVYCKYCGAEIDADSKFCNKCGKEQ